VIRLPASLLMLTPEQRTELAKARIEIEVAVHHLKVDDAISQLMGGAPPSKHWRGKARAR